MLKVTLIFRVFYIDQSADLVSNNLSVSTIKYSMTEHYATQMKFTKNIAIRRFHMSQTLEIMAAEHRLLLNIPCETVTFIIANFQV